MRLHAGITILILACAASSAGQAAPAFEAVSIRPSPPHYGPVSAFSVFSGGPGSTDPERLTIREFGVENLILRAYSLTGDVRITGLDKIPVSDKIPVPWIEVEKFDIDAKVPPGTTKEQLPLMLQNMLGERFGLKVHFEKKEAPTYDLVVAKLGGIAKGNPGLIPSGTLPDPGDSKPLKPFTLPAAGGAPFEADKNGFPIIPKGSAVNRIGGSRSRGIWRKETMEKLAAELSSFPAIRRVVRDATGLKGEYDFSLYWTQENVSWTDGVRDPPPAEPLGGPSIFEALEKQLGLKLEPSTGRVDYLVIDHIDRTPTEN